MAFGLVFAGGGVRGAYHIGVWKALNEMNIDVCAVSGTSIGAINGALFVQGMLETAEKLWNDIELSDIVTLPPELACEKNLFGIKNIVKIASASYKNDGLDMKPLEKLLDSVINEEAFRHSSIDFGLTTYSVTEKKLVTITKNEIPYGSLIPYLMASACLPGFKIREINQKKFIDGGVLDNMPIDILAKKGIADIITVNAKGIGVYRDFNTSGCNIIPIECNQPHTGTMDFDKDGIKNSITKGYLDCLRTFGRLFGKECYFDIKEYTRVYSRFGEKFADGIQYAAKAFGIPLLRVVEFDTLVKEVIAAYLIQKEITPSYGENKLAELLTAVKQSRLDDKTVICILADILEKDGFDFAKSKLDILGKYYDAASAILYLKKRIS